MIQEELGKRQLEDKERLRRFQKNKIKFQVNLKNDD